MQWHPWPTSHSWAKSTLFAPTDLRAVHTASRLNFRVIHCLCFRLCQRTRIACCLAEQTLPLISSFMLDRSRDCLLTRRVTKQRDSFKTRLTDSHFQFVAAPAESDQVTTDTESRTEVLEVMEPLALKFGNTPSIPIGCNRLQPIRKFGVSTVLAVIGVRDGGSGGGSWPPNSGRYMTFIRAKDNTFVWLTVSPRTEQVSIYLRYISGGVYKGDVHRV